MQRDVLDEREGELWRGTGAMVETMKKTSGGLLAAVTKRRMSLLVVPVSQSGASRQRARACRQRPEARGSSALKVCGIFVRRDSVAVGKARSGK